MFIRSVLHFNEHGLAKKRQFILLLIYLKCVFKYVRWTLFFFNVVNFKSKLKPIKIFLSFFLSFFLHSFSSWRGAFRLLLLTDDMRGPPPPPPPSSSYPSPLLLFCLGEEEEEEEVEGVERPVKILRRFSRFVGLLTAVGVWNGAGIIIQTSGNAAIAAM